MLKYRNTNKVLIGSLIFLILFVSGYLIGTFEKKYLDTPEVIFSPSVVNDTETAVIEESSSPIFRASVQLDRKSARLKLYPNPMKMNFHL